MLIRVKKQYKTKTQLMFTSPSHPKVPPTPQTHTWRQSEVGPNPSKAAGGSELCSNRLMSLFNSLSIPLGWYSQKITCYIWAKIQIQKTQIYHHQDNSKECTVGWKTVSRETCILRMFSVMAGSLKQGLTSSLGINIIRIHVLRTVNIPTHNIIAAPSALGSRKCFQPFLFRLHSPLTVSCASKSAALAGLKMRRESTKRLRCGPASLLASFERP